VGGAARAAEKASDTAAVSVKNHKKRRTARKCISYAIIATEAARTLEFRQRIRLVTVAMSAVKGDVADDVQFGAALL